MAKETTKISADEALAQVEARNARQAEIRARREDERKAREGETKADAFKRIALRRTNNALDEIAKLRGLSSKANYEYTEEQYTKILGALRAEVDKVESDFKRGGPSKAEGFNL